jgi:FKBP-type peptidyl-prolyl cis-trans isomerase
MKAIKDYIVANNIDVEFDTANSIYYQVHTEGTGYKALRGTAVDLHYRGETLSGAVFVNTFSGSPEKVYIGTKNDYPSSNPASYAWGLDEWLLSKQKEGDSLTVFLPSAYAFKDQSYSTVGPNTPVLYHVKFLDIKLLSEELVKIDDYIADKSWTGSIEPTYGTRYVVHKLGDPEKNIEFGDYVSINYQGTLLDGTSFDSNYDKSPWSFTLGTQSLIPGFELGLDLLNEGDSATFFVPSIYGYGKDGSGSKIPGNATLVFKVSVRDLVPY